MIEYEWIRKEYCVWMKWLMVLDGEECQLCMLECVKMCICAIWVRAECHKQGGRGKVFIRCGCCILNKCGLNVVVGRNDGI